MSRHHARLKHSTGSKQLRREYAARLPLPCTECGRPVEPGQVWHVAHLTPAERDGATTRANTGIAHARCNTRAGGKRGAAITNARRRAAQHRGEGIRAW